MIRGSDVPRYHLSTAWFVPYQILSILFTIFTHANCHFIRVQWRNNNLRKIIGKQSAKQKLHYIFR
jgi:hypothetical protein